MKWQLTFSTFDAEEGTPSWHGAFELSLGTKSIVWRYQGLGKAPLPDRPKKKEGF